MEELVTAGAIAALLVGVHAVFAVYLYRILSAERENAAAPTETVRTGSAAAEEAPPGESRSVPERKDGRSTVPCPVCGTPNGPSFQFCRRCVADLSGGSMSVNGTADGSSG